MSRIRFLPGLLLLLLLVVTQERKGEAEPQGPAVEQPNAEKQPPPPLEKGPNSRVQLALNPGGHTAPIRRADFTPDGKRLVTIGEDRTVQVWDMDTGERVKVLWLPAGNVEGLSGKADPDKISKQLLVHHLFSYVYDTVTRETSMKQMPLYLPSGSVPPIVLEE